KLDLAMAKVDQVSGVFSILIGQVASSEAFTFGDDKLALAKQATSFQEIPFGAQPAFLDENLVLAGPTGATRKELSALPIDIRGRRRMEQKLWDTTGKISQAAIAPRGNIAGIGGKYHVVWSETLTDANGQNGYDQLWYAQIECL